MRENVTEVVTGALVLAAGAGFLVYAAQFADGRGIGAGSYPLTASFRSAEGVTVGTDVRLAGVRIGTVTGMDLNPETFRADTTFAIDTAVALPADTAVVVASEGLLGGNYIEMLPGGALETLEPGAEIEDTQSAVSLMTLLMRYVTGSEEP